MNRFSALNLPFRPAIRPVLFAVFCLVVTGVSAQSWYLQKTPDDLYIVPHEISKTPDNKLFVVGQVQPFGSVDAEIFYGKYHKGGGDVYQYRLDVSADEDGLSNAVRGGGESMLVTGFVGHRYNYGQRMNSEIPLCTEQARMYVAKIGSAGAVVWQRTFGNGCDSYGYDIVARKNSDQYAAVGNHYSPATDMFDIYLVLVDENGNPGGQKVIGSYGKSLYARRILSTSDGGFVILGQEGDNKHHPYKKSENFENFTGESSLVIRLDANADLVWARRISYPASIGAHAVLATDLLENSAGDIYLAGTINDLSIPPSYTRFDRGFLVRLDGNGALVSDIVFNLNGPGSGKTVVQSLLREGNTLYLSGYAYGGFGNYTKFLLSIDATTLTPQTVLGLHPGFAYGSMRHTGTGGTSIFLVGNAPDAGDFFDLTKKQMGGAVCYENQQWFASDPNLCIVENASLDLTSAGIATPQSPQTTPLAVSLVTASLCSASKTYSPPESEGEMAPGIYPNPASDRVHIITRHESPTALRIHNSRGQLILSRELQAGDHALDTSEMESGIYFLEMRRSGQVHTEKLIIQH